MKPVASEPWTLRDMKVATGLSMKTCAEYIVDGFLPGYKVGSRYIIPAQWADDWLHGRWSPKRADAEPAAVPPEVINPSQFVKRINHQSVSVSREPANQQNTAYPVPALNESIY